MTTRILVTGAGGPAAVAFIKALGPRTCEIFCADMDPHAVGLYLVPRDRRFLIPAGSAPGFAQALLALCVEHRIDLLVPTVDAELMPIANMRRRFERLGVEIALAPTGTLEICLDKWALVQHVESDVRVPRTAVFDADFDTATVSFPLIIKPREGSGSRGVRLVRDAEALEAIPRSGALIVQEYLPGAEYSVDVFADGEGRVRAVVPRERLKIDSGVAVTARSLNDDALEEAARTVAEAIGLVGVANVQFKLAVTGEPALLEVNPRFPGTMSLTVASGVNMPTLVVDLSMGRPLPEGTYGFEPIEMMRCYQEVFAAPGTIAQVVSSNEARVVGVGLV